MTRVAIIGSGGQLGSDLVTSFREAGSYTVFPLTHAEIECTELASVRKMLAEVHPDLVVNCAASIRVDECEDHSDDAFRNNAVGALYVARVCDEVGALCVYISSDYVFDGEKGGPYTEEDLPQPINVYGASKLAGEFLVRQGCSRWLIIRTASLFGRTGARGKDGNFLETILAKARRDEPIRVVNDIRMSPTYTYDAAWSLEKLWGAHATGLVHLTNAGSCTWYEFARMALNLLDIRGNLEPVSSGEYPTKARRPRDSSLSSIKLSALIPGGMRPWRDALRAYLIEKPYLKGL